MDTNAAALEDTLLRDPATPFLNLKLSPAVWAGITLTLLFGAAVAWRMVTCLYVVLACTR
jgi:hypothetical protein